MSRLNILGWLLVGASLVVLGYGELMDAISRDSVAGIDRYAGILLGGAVVSFLLEIFRKP